MPLGCIPRGQDVRGTQLLPSDWVRCCLLAILLLGTDASGWHFEMEMQKGGGEYGDSPLQYARFVGLVVVLIRVS